MIYIYVNNEVDCYNEQVKHAVAVCEKEHNVQLMSGSFYLSGGPGYNFGYEIAEFYNLSEEQAGTVKNALFEQGIPGSDIRVVETNKRAAP